MRWGRVNTYVDRCQRTLHQHVDSAVQFIAIVGDLFLADADVFKQYRVVNTARALNRNFDSRHAQLLQSGSILRLLLDERSDLEDQCWRGQ